MEKSCSFKRLYGGQCGKDPRSKKDGVIVPLVSCEKDISNHKSSLNLMSAASLDTEVELILARSSIFTLPSNISDLDICSAHRSSLGIGWRKGSKRCRVPVQLSNHLQKSRAADRGISKQISQHILNLTGIFLPVGSR